MREAAAARKPQAADAPAARRPFLGHERATSLRRIACRCQVRSSAEPAISGRLSRGRRNTMAARLLRAACQRARARRHAMRDRLILLRHAIDAQAIIASFSSPRGVPLATPSHYFA